MQRNCQSNNLLQRKCRCNKLEPIIFMAYCNEITEVITYYNEKVVVIRCNNYSLLQRNYCCINLLPRSLLQQLATTFWSLQ